jgi:molecular chaperone GrpE (heat shock protein)
MKKRISTRRPKPTPVSWANVDAVSPMAVLEEDTKRLMHELAEARAVHEESTRGETRRTEQLLLKLLDVVDAFDRVLNDMRTQPDQPAQTQIWIGRFRTVRILLDDLLAEQGVVPIENLDDGFDPHWHKPVEAIDDASRRAGTIVEEVKRGYIWRQRVLRKTEVVVSRVPQTEVSEQPAPSSDDETRS